MVGPAPSRGWSRAHNMHDLQLGCSLAAPHGRNRCHASVCWHPSFVIRTGHNDISVILRSHYSYSVHQSMSRRTSSAKELPPCPGPKLHIFPHHKLPIQWIERLDCDRDEDSIGEGYVFRAKIGSREYAVKVVRYFPSGVMLALTASSSSSMIH